MSTGATLGAADRATEDGEDMWCSLDALARTVRPLDLGIGCPDFAPPAQLTRDLQEVVDGENFMLHQYTKGFGHPRLVSALTALYDAKWGGQVPPDAQVVVTNGATEALFVSFMGLLNPGDEVIIIEPFFSSYSPQVKMAGGQPVFVSLRQVESEKGKAVNLPASSASSADWKLDFKELTDAFTDRTKAIVINTPHNPTGKVLSRNELQQIAEVCLSHDVVVISDEVYANLTYDGTQHVSIATLPGMWDRTITIGSAGKTFSATGWKIGWMMGPADLLAGPKVVHQNSGYICITPFQEALARSFERETKLLLANSPYCYFTSLCEEAQKKRDILVKLLMSVGIIPIVPQGGYFVLCDIRELMDKVDIGGDEKEPRDFRFVKWLSKNRKLQGIPPSSFFSEENRNVGENYMRLCFIKKDSTLHSAEVIFNKLAVDLKSGTINM